MTGPHSELKRTTCIIIDDEELARGIVREYIAGHRQCEILAECSNGFEAVKAVTELQPDLLFLDIQMPKLNGFEVLELIEHPVAVIFTTAYDEYALKAFDVHAVDYLLKPFSRQRFDEAIGRAMERASRSQHIPLKQIITDAKAKEQPARRILVRDGSKVHIIPAEKVDYLEAQDDYVCVHTEGRRLLKQTTLSEFEGEMDPAQFIRIHRSFILNIERLAKIELYAKDSRVAILKDGARLQVSRSGYAKLKTVIGE